MSVAFFVGIHQPSDAHRFQRCCISIHRLGKRLKPLGCPEVFIDSGAFTTIDKHGGYPAPVGDYAKLLHRLVSSGTATVVAAAAQDYMCEKFVIAKVLGIDVADLTPARHAEMVREHQRKSIERYDALLVALDELFGGDIPFAVLPVLQGYYPEEYVRHVRMYGHRLKTDMWVGVGSVCKRNSSVADVVHVLSSIRDFRPDLRLHGFGLKKTALQDSGVRASLHSADSMAWSLHARKHGRSANDWREAQAFSQQVESVTDLTETHWQPGLPLEAAE